MARNSPQVSCISTTLEGKRALPNDSWGAICRSRIAFKSAQGNGCLRLLEVRAKFHRQLNRCRQNHRSSGLPEPQPSKSEARKHYFVDEAGDAVLFGSRGKVLIGSDGCSRFFILGLLDVRDPERLATELAELRKSLLADPYFKGVPSMQTDEQKTALFFHAKDRYRHDELYDHMLRRLFKQRLHTHDAYRVTFATRGHKGRTEALRLALETARERFAEEHGISSRAAIEVVPATPPQAAGLQAVDYFL